MRVLHVVDRVLLRALLREIDVELDRLVVAARDEVPARGVDADGVEQLVEEDDVATTLRHLPRLPPLDEMDELVDEHLERLARVAEHLGERLQPCDVAVVVGPEDVDQPIEAARVLPANVRRVGREVARGTVRPDEHAILVVAVRARPRPQCPVGLERVQERDRFGDLGLCVALQGPAVEVDSEALERRLDALEHRRHGIAGKCGELGDVLAAVAVLGRLFAASDRLDRGVETLHLPPRVVVVVLALDLVAGEREQARPPSRRRPRCVRARR